MGADEEDDIRRQKEKEVIAMEKVELELINKLNNTLALQKQAYEELDRALKSPHAISASFKGSSFNLHHASTARSSYDRSGAAELAKTKPSSTGVADIAMQESSV